MSQTVGIIDCGVTLIIEETLASDVDQKSKIKDASNAYEPVLVYQPDYIKQTYLITKLQKKSLKINKDYNYSIFIYNSLECLMGQHCRTWMVTLLNKGALMRFIYL